MVTTTNIYQTGLKFLEIASKYHEDVNQKFDGKPYSIHLSAVLRAALQYSYYFPDEVNDYLDVIVFGACFHDTIEDARLTYNDVLKIASKYISDKDKAIMATEIVYALTNEKGNPNAMDNGAAGLLLTYSDDEHIGDKEIPMVYIEFPKLFNSNNNYLSVEWHEDGVLKVE